MPDESVRAPFWFRAVTGPGAHVSGVRAALAAGGLDPRPWEPGVPGPGVLLYTSLDGEARAALREVRHGGRVLALCLAREGVRTAEAWALLRSGAQDVMAWGEGRDADVAAVLSRMVRWRRVEELMDSSAVRDNLVGGSTVWRSVLEDVVETAYFTDNPVLLTGETGTGKELAARLVNALDQRSDRTPLVLVDCTTITPTLAGSEFFGHEKGSFTGALSARDGAFALADQGTLFLDEVGELPPDLQAELLRVIQEGAYKRVGGNTWRSTRFRLVCATNQDLEECIRQGRFRGDLFYRIAASRFHLPPLRERPDDVLPLADHFLEQLIPGHPRPHFDPAVRDMLVGLRYPGNVRELRQLVARIAARHAGSGAITAGAVPPSERPRQDPDPVDRSLTAPLRLAAVQGVTLAEVTEAARNEMIALVIADETERGRPGRLRRAADRLGVSVRTLQMWQRSHSAQAAGGTGAPEA
ncbi:sigma-54-dependent Fis family transcriptional regulator [Nocardiopsis terrae]|uniref:Transcriptional regulator with GAF, ATPase, and Fis domain n=1 Tax=Nocardiopsis terrae TaxID=372655 RepID=A0ABR9HHN5_9ACTN|nr:sigma 54-interacting transcriptional regulator [Nocardiopsis terrae]MBE1458542.1 transcriptional regulator with GAF, ATPase, and Fis domain [Nocardiopsis terrae]GHC79850.1 sigma-54-dependent Fis family transcriptional regulator [Nocardiopsis terrae]